MRASGCIWGRRAAFPHEAAGPVSGRPGRRRAAGAGDAEAAGVRERGAERPAAGRAEPRHLEPARVGLRGAPSARRHDPLLLQPGPAGRRLGRAAALQAGHGLPRRVGHGRPSGPGPGPAPPRLPLRVRRFARHRPCLRAQPHRRGGSRRRPGVEGRPGEPAAAVARRRPGESPPEGGDCGPALPFPPPRVPVRPLTLCVCAAGHGAGDACGRTRRRQDRPDKGWSV